MCGACWPTGATGPRARPVGDRDWLEDGDIPDDPQLESEITAVWVLREDESGLLLTPKREVRQKLKVSPDGSDTCVLCHAGHVRKTNNAPLRMYGGGRR